MELGRGSEQLISLQMLASVRHEGLPLDYLDHSVVQTIKSVFLSSCTTLYPGGRYSIKKRAWCT